MTCPWQASRTRIMPSSVPSRNGFTFQPWINSKQSRHSSSAQDFKTVIHDQRMAAVLHGKNTNGGGEDGARRSPSEHAATQPSSHQSNTASRHNAQKSEQSQQSNNQPNRKRPWEQRGTMSRKRKATSPLAQPTSRRPRSNAPTLKDEAYIRSTMRIPTPQEYPNAPKDVFKTPRSSIVRVAHGCQLAECRSEVTALSKDVYQCTAFYKSAMHSEAVIGEGRTEASRSVS